MTIGDKELRDAVNAALESAGICFPTESSPELVFSDARKRTNKTGEDWNCHILKTEKGKAFIGPFLTNSRHPLTAGLSFPGMVWSTGNRYYMPGTPVISAANTVLVSDASNLDGHHIYLRINPRRSTVLQSTVWPILFLNLLEWRTAERRGFRDVNLRLGQIASFNSKTTETAELERPDGTRRAVALEIGRHTIIPNQPGIYELATDTASYALSVNAIDAEESDLRDRVTTTAGTWVSDAAKRTEYASLSWIFILLGLAALVAHHYLVARGC